MDEDKGTVFNGLFSGANYDRFAVFSGCTASFYRKAAARIPLEPGMRVLDLGCGTASLGLAVAELMGSSGEVHGVDLAEEQLAHARNKTKNAEIPFEFHCCSMDELPFPEDSFDAVVTSLALHATPPEVRRRAISEVSRVLKPGGIFGLVDWSRPRFGLWGLIWLPMLLPRMKGDNWRNTYPDLCLQQQMGLQKDDYVNSLVRCQVFRKRDLEPSRV